MFSINKKYLISFFIVMSLAVFGLQAKAQDYSQVTDDQNIIKALDLLRETTGEWSREAILGNNLTGEPIKISFADLSKISKAYSTYEALSWIKNKQLLIFISHKHKKAPPEVLACILAHEAIHQDEYLSLKEEAYGWATEADVWIQLKAKNPELSKLSEKDSPLVARLNMLEESFRKGNYTTDEIEPLVAKNPAYRNLPLTSYGFGR